MLNKKLYDLAKKLFPIHRSLAGPQNRKTLKLLKKIYPKLKIKGYDSGKKVFDWIIPYEWSVNSAWIKDSSGKKIVDIKNNNLHLVSYSKPIDKKINFNTLQKHLYSSAKQPNAIPYVTSYYKKNWGFCVSHKERKKLKKNSDYRVYIDSSFKKGKLNFGEIVIKGKSKREVFLSTYICHPSLANNEVSGPTVAIFLAKWIASQKKLNYTYRVIFIAETIGSIAYLSHNFKQLKKNVFAGFNISCVGDNRNYSFLPSRNENTISDRVAQKVLRKKVKKFKKYSWLERGSDERQYCSPGIDLPVSSIMRTKYGEYPEYHTSLDTLGNVVNAKGLLGGYNILKEIILEIEKNIYPLSQIYCEPFLTKHKIYSTISRKENKNLKTSNLLNVLSYCDGKHSLKEIEKKTKIRSKKILNLINKLKKLNLIENF